MNTGIFNLQFSKYFIFIVLSLFILTGCAHKEADIVVKKEVETIYVKPDEKYTEKIKIPEPISKENYLKLNLKEREKELTLYIIDLLKLLHIENEKKDSLHQYIENIK